MRRPPQSRILRQPHFWSGGRPFEKSPGTTFSKCLLSTVPVKYTLQPDREQGKPPVLQEICKVVKSIIREPENGDWLRAGEYCSGDSWCRRCLSPFSGGDTGAPWKMGTGTEPGRFPAGLTSTDARSQSPFSTPQYRLCSSPDPIWEWPTHTTCWASRSESDKLFNSRVLYRASSGR